MKATSLLRGSVIVTLGTVIGGLLSYVFSVAMGRLLGPAQFGDLGAIGSLLAIVTSISGAILTVVMHYSAVLKAEGRFDQIWKLQRRFSRGMVIGSLALIVVLVLLVPTTARLFSISDNRAVYISLLSIAFSFLAVINRGVLQGTQQFLGLAISNISELTVKLLAALLLVYLGWSLFGATTAMVLASFVASASSLWWLKKSLKADPTQPISTNSVLSRAEIMSYLWPTIIATFLLLAAMNMDVIFIKRFFAPEEAGQYIAVSTIAKIIFYITGPISLVMFPLIAEQRAKNEKHYQVLLLSLVMTIIVSAGLFLLYSVFQEKIVITLYGNKFGSLGHLLPASAWLVIFLSLINLMVQYFMSIKHFAFVYFFVPILLGTFWQISRVHTTLGGVIHNMQQGMALLFLSLLVYYLISKRAQLLDLFRTLNA